MKPSVYIETAIPSYLTASHNPSLLMAAHQEATRNWWDTARFDYDLFISEFVMAECASGNADAAERRLAAIQKFAGTGHFQRSCLNPLAFGNS
jgi:hypothetical protein